MQTSSADLLERFSAKMAPPDANGCRPWLGVRMGNGYGVMWVGGKRGNNRGAHRLSWVLFRGPIPPGLMVRHLCHNRWCTEPSHLALGTHEDNMRDMTEAGRQAVGERHGSRTSPERLRRGSDHPSRLHPGRQPRGEASSRAKLTADQVRSIRARYASGGVSQAALAAEHGVSERAVHFIVHRKHWRHVS